MNLVIYKYPIDITSQQFIEMPKGAKLLHVALDGWGKPCIWAQVDTDQPKVKRMFFIYGTGAPMRHHENYVGTFVEGKFVWHVFN